MEEDLAADPEAHDKKKKKKKIAAPKAFSAPPEDEADNEADATEETGEPDAEKKKKKKKSTKVGAEGAEAEKKKKKKKSTKVGAEGAEAEASAGADSPPSTKKKLKKKATAEAGALEEAAAADAVEESATGDAAPSELLPEAEAAAPVESDKKKKTKKAKAKDEDGEPAGGEDAAGGDNAIGKPSKAKKKKKQAVAVEKAEASDDEKVQYSSDDEVRVQRAAAAAKAEEEAEERKRNSQMSMPADNELRVAEPAALEPQPAQLNIYEVGATCLVTVGPKKSTVAAVGTGIFHVAVEIYGKEWAYGYCDSGTGVFPGKPKEHSVHKFRESVELKVSPKSPDEIQANIDQLSNFWHGNGYDLLRRNAVHFADTLVRSIEVGGLPKWVMDLAGAGPTAYDECMSAASEKGLSPKEAKAELNYDTVMTIAKERRVKEEYSISGHNTAKAKDVVKKGKVTNERFRIECAAPAKGVKFGLGLGGSSPSNEKDDGEKKTVRKTGFAAMRSGLSRITTMGTFGRSKSKIEGGGGGEDEKDAESDEEVASNNSAGAPRTPQAAC